MQHTLLGPLFMKCLVPAYAYPSPDSSFWHILFGYDTSRIEVVLNVNSGPGSDVEPNYAKLIRQLRQRTIPILGYVATTYANKPVADVQKEIAMWSSIYAIADIFLDEVSSERYQVSYYESIYRSSRGRVVLNPGTTPDSAYFPYGDVTITAECGLEEYSKLKFSWGKSSGASAHIVHGVKTENQMKKVMNKARKWASYVYITDSQEYDRVPQYWRAFLKEIAK